MIRRTNPIISTIGNVNYVELAGLSTDTKPTLSIATGSLFFEVDTADVYAYDEESQDWLKVCSLGGDD